MCERFELGYVWRYDRGCTRGGFTAPFSCLDYNIIYVSCSVHSSKYNTEANPFNRTLSLVHDRELGN